MDEKARKFFHKEYAELSDYERMMLDIMGDGEEADSAEEIAPETPEEVEAPAAELPPEEPEAAPETPEEPDTSEVTLLPVSEETEELPAAFPAEDAPLEAHTQRPESPRLKASLLRARTRRTTAT